MTDHRTPDAEPQPVRREDEVLDSTNETPETEKIEDEGEPLGANFA